MTASIVHGMDSIKCVNAVQECKGKGFINSTFNSYSVLITVFTDVILYLLYFNILHVRLLGLG